MVRLTATAPKIIQTGEAVVDSAGVSAGAVVATLTAFTNAAELAATSGMGVAVELSARAMVITAGVGVSIGGGGFCL
jgi:hypothetical protein